MKFQLIAEHKHELSVKRLCQLTGVSRSGFYAWSNRPAKVISYEELMLYRTAKQLFNASRQSLGSRELMKKLREQGFTIGRDKTRTIMQKLGLRVTTRQAYKATTKRKHSDAVAGNLLNQNFNPLDKNQVWAGDITYLKTEEGWMYLSVIMDLYSRRIVGWAIDKHMSSALVIRSLMMAINLRKPTEGLVFHSDRGSQYTSKQTRKLLTKFNMRASMGSVGACWDNAVVERFFGSLKHDWIYKVHQPTRLHMREDVKQYIRYYNLERLHTSNGDMSPVNYENLKGNVSKNG